MATALMAFLVVLVSPFWALGICLLFQKNEEWDEDSRYSYIDIPSTTAQCDTVELTHK